MLFGRPVSKRLRKQYMTRIFLFSVRSGPVPVRGLGGTDGL
jgi:hypothetical protein